MAILVLILMSSYTFMFESHPYIRCTYSAEIEAHCTGGGDPTGEFACTQGQELDVVTGLMVNNTFSPFKPAVGMYADCESAPDEKTCVGEVTFMGHVPDEHHMACAWENGVCTFVGSPVLECTQWVSPFGSEDFIGDAQHAKVVRHRFRMIEVTAIFVFTIEYVIRIGLCTFRPGSDQGFLSYALAPMNLIDFFAIIPFWFELFFEGNTGMGILRLLRLARIFRVLKAGNFLGELQLFARGYSRASEGLKLLFFLLFLYLCVFAAVLYLIEYESATVLCYQDAGVCAMDPVTNATACAEDVCWVDLQGVEEDEIDGSVVALTRTLEGPDAPSPFTGPISTCNKCHYDAYNCTNGAQFQIVHGSEIWDFVGNVQGACATMIGNCSSDPSNPNGPGFSDCEGKVQLVPCDSGLLLAPGSTANPNILPLEAGWFDKVECTTCHDLGCGTRAFTSIPTTWYFIMATMTTVGYGDHYPMSMWGQIVSGLCMLVGILVLALPIIVIGWSFEEVVREDDRFKAEKKTRLSTKKMEKQEEESMDGEGQEGEDMNGSPRASGMAGKLGGAAGKFGGAAGKLGGLGAGLGGAALGNLGAGLKMTPLMKQQEVKHPFLLSTRI
jgi:hypothetical protein